MRLATCGAARSILRKTRYTCARCVRQGYCPVDRPDLEKGMEDHVFERASASPIAAAARNTPVGRPFVPDKLRPKPTW